MDLDFSWPEAGGGFEIADPDIPGVGTYDVSAAAQAAAAAAAPSYTMAGACIHTTITRRRLDSSFLSFATDEKHEIPFMVKPVVVGRKNVMCE